MIRILLCGYYGFDNAGDEAVLAGLIYALCESATEPITITAMSFNPAKTEAEHGIRAVHRYKQALQAIIGCDILLLGGGSLLQDVTSAHGIYYYLSLVRIAQLLGKKTMFIAQGIGPLVRPKSRRYTAAVANRTTSVTVRDNGSAALLRGIGVDRTRVVITADPALLLGDASEYSADGPIGLSLRPWLGKEETIKSMLVQAWAEATDNSPVQPLIMHAHTDDILPELPNILPTAPSSDYKELIATTSRCSLVIGMRLHSLIFAALSGIPAIALSYDPKTDAFMQQSGQGDAIFDIRQLDQERLNLLIRRVWNDREARAATLRARLPEMRAAAMKNAEIALTLCAPHAERALPK